MPYLFFTETYKKFSAIKHNLALLTQSFLISFFFISDRPLNTCKTWSTFLCNQAHTLLACITEHHLQILKKKMWWNPCKIGYQSYTFPKENNVRTGIFTNRNWVIMYSATYWQKVKCSFLVHRTFGEFFLKH